MINSGGWGVRGVFSFGKLFKRKGNSGIKGGIREE